MAYKPNWSELKQQTEIAIYAFVFLCQLFHYLRGVDQVQVHIHNYYIFVTIWSSDCES